MADDAPDTAAHFEWFTITEPPHRIVTTTAILVGKWIIVGGPQRVLVIHPANLVEALSAFPGLPCTVSTSAVKTPPSDAPRAIRLSDDLGGETT